MTAKLISGTDLSKIIREELKSEVELLKSKNIQPGLAVVLVGDDPASEIYVGRKDKACDELGIYSEVHKLPETTTERELVLLIRKLNVHTDIHGILVQLPLPEHISEKAVIGAIAVEKDVDGFHPINVGNLLIGDNSLLPCTPAGVIEMIKREGIEIAGKHAVVIGRSNIVGKPVSMLLLRENATVSICHSKTPDISSIAKQADILVVATGIPKMIGSDCIKEGAVVIDVGINRMDNGKLCGDVDFDKVKDLAGYITPVPGGVGPMTITMLIKNTLEAASKSIT